ncbi:MAG: UDP-N-acetylmuramate--L-alanine ligase [Flammeovirgaceae bacterium]|nr:MAG: UDP-N-acetylmuramate--L-alanine ligase [Flammeovirgaceae bacterium]
MKLENYHNVYFLGIGGIGMSAIARWFLKKGLRVSGYDRTPTSLTAELQQEGMHIHFEDGVENIPSEVRTQKENTLVVFTPAIPKDHAEFNYLKAQGYTIMKRSEVLGLLTRNYKTIAVAGTHGKTTTSSMIAHILKAARANMVGFLGGITTNYESNLVMEGEINANTLVVVEADEFDRSFLRLFPHTGVVTSADADHLDIYGNHESMLTSFRDFIRQISQDGELIIHESVDALLTADIQIKNKITYGMSRGQFFAGNIAVTRGRDGFFEFDLCGFDTVHRITLGVPGFHNVENAIAAALACYRNGISMAVIKPALASFKGVKRRFEFVVKSDKVVYVDDYAHHPTEIEAFLQSMRSMYPGKKLTVVFQPHLYTRTRDFAEGFAKSLSLADDVLLMDIYPARELPIPGVDADLIYNHVTAKNKERCSKGNLLEKLKSRELEVLTTVGAGDIDTFVQPIKEILKTRYEG